MGQKIFVGEFEQLLLLAILHLDNDAAALPLLERMEALAGRRVSRGAVYRTLDRLEARGWVRWSLDTEERPERGGHPRRRFTVTKPGIAALKTSRRTLMALWQGVERLLR